MESPLSQEEKFELALKEFAKSHSRESNPTLDEYFALATKTGQALFPWTAVGPFIISKLEAVMEEMANKFPYDHLPPQPNTDNTTADVYIQRILHRASLLDGIPFTFHRLLELISQPTKHYRRTDKYLRAVEKVIWVVSTIEPVNSRTDMSNGSAGPSQVATPMEAEEAHLQYEVAARDSFETLETPMDEDTIDDEQKENCRPAWSHGVAPRVILTGTTTVETLNTVEISSLPSLSPSVGGPMPSIEAMWGQRQSVPTSSNTQEAISMWPPAQLGAEPNFATMTPLQVPSLSTSSQLRAVDSLPPGSVVETTEEFINVDSTVEIVTTETIVETNVTSTSEDSLNDSADSDSPDTTKLEPPEKKGRWDPAESGGAAEAD